MKARCERVACSLDRELIAYPETNTSTSNGMGSSSTTSVVSCKYRRAAQPGKSVRPSLSKISLPVVPFPRIFWLAQARQVCLCSGVVPTASATRVKGAGWPRYPLTEESLFEADTTYRRGDGRCMSAVDMVYRHGQDLSTATAFKNMLMFREIENISYSVTVTPPYEHPQSHSKASRKCKIYTKDTQFIQENHQRSFEKWRNQGTRMGGSFSKDRKYYNVAVAQCEEARIDDE